MQGLTFENMHTVYGAAESATIIGISFPTGCPLFFAVARFGLCTNLVVEQCTRKYTVQQTICKSARRKQAAIA